MTIAEIITYGKISSYLARNDVSNGVIWGTRVNPKLPLLISMETDILEWQNTFNPADTTLTNDANYVYSLCGAYNLRAKYVTGNGSTAGSVSPIGFTYLIPISGSDFNLNGVADATHYDNTKIVGKNLQIFWNDTNRFLLSSEFAYTLTGFNVLISGFNAINNPTWEFNIYIVNV